MIDQIDKDVTNETVNAHTVMFNAEFTAVRHYNSPHQCWQQLDAPSDVIVRDFHDQDKVRAFCLVILWILSLLVRIGIPPTTLPS